MAGCFFSDKRRCGSMVPAAVFWLLAGFVCLFLSHRALARPYGGGEIRSLKIYFVHTQERDNVVFKKNGRYVRSGLKRLDYLLRDWRRNEAVNMDPRLFDLIWQIYQLSGSKDYIHAVSGYRSPQTNAMLRLASPAGTVARHSRHMEGQAMDFYLPDVNPAYLRAVALKLQGGGIGYYPASASPFVHVDVGQVRHWPRMSRQALAALFPDGKSLHVPNDGRPLAHYQEAAADYRQRGAAAVPVLSSRVLFGGLSPQQVTLVAADGRLPPGRSGMAALPPAAVEMAAAPAPVLAGFAPGRVPIPIAAKPFGPETEDVFDEADMKTAFIPVPQFKAEADIEESGNALLAYAPLDRAEAVLGNRALQALSDIVPLPAARPLPLENGEAGRSDRNDSSNKAKPRIIAVIVPLPQARPTGQDKTGALAAVRGETAPLPYIPLPRAKNKSGHKAKGTAPMIFAADRPG
ncbi:MAG: DUF882 domain-containing protein [Candidatus Tokpelaia sp.]|nr:MAG: DUF882 domain-containing protein [Candidatus Tokpelaia sp.]KAA6207371.1 MAG: DUF882 domain-containing protein [Candidatus Tokpelaia sp.]